jgi:hypothetical protein
MFKIFTLFAFFAVSVAFAPFSKAKSFASVNGKGEVTALNMVRRYFIPFQYCFTLAEFYLSD